MIEARLNDTRQAFDSVAAVYDGAMGNNALIQRMRRQLWRTVAMEIPAGSRLLDLGCGTGIDAEHFGRRGYRVLATDWSPAMVDRTRWRVAQNGLDDAVSAEAIGMHQLDRLVDERFDGIYSDLGALNCVPDLAKVARSCAVLLNPGGRIIASVIGRRCPWEAAFYLSRGDAKRARVRSEPDVVPVSLNGHRVWTRYYTPREFYTAFASEFELASYRGLGLFLPPPYLIRWYERLGPLFTPLGWLDDRLGAFPPLRDVGDHFLIVMTRRSHPRWQIGHPGCGWQPVLGRWRERLPGRREPAAFPVVNGRPGRAPPPRTSHAPIARAAARIFLRLRFRLFQRGRYDRLVLETVLGTPILVLPGVFNPKLLRTGELLVRALDAQPVRPESSVLDLGTGSGVGAVFAGRRARRVVAVDINPEAVRCAEINFRIHHLVDRCEAREGDLFGPVETERFDLVLFNPPFFRGQPRDTLDRAWRATDVVERVATRLEDHLTPDGYALVILSSDGDADAFLDAFRSNDLTVEVVAWHDLVNETLAVYRVQKARR